MKKTAGIFAALCMMFGLTSTASAHHKPGHGGKPTTTTTVPVTTTTIQSQECATDSDALFGFDSFELIDQDRNAPGLGFRYHEDGCVMFKTFMTQNGYELAFAGDEGVPTGTTWEDWGVPAGATVNTVQITGWQERLVTGQGIVDHRIRIAIMAQDEELVTGGFIVNQAMDTGPDASWEFGSPGSVYPVDLNYNTSDTDVRLVLRYDLNAPVLPVDVEQRIDEIQLAITYTV